MIIERNGIRYERLQQKDIEEVRQWRNSDFIKQFMNFREYITPEMQQNWFNSINNENNLYFIIWLDGKKSGLANAKDIDWEKGTAEMGIFLINKELLSTPLPVIGAIGLSSIVFDVLRFNKVFAHIRKDNPRAVKFNTSMGFTIEPRQEEELNQLHSLTPDNFYRKGTRLLKAFETLGYSENKLRVVLQPHDFENGIGQKLESLIHDSGLSFDLLTYDDSKVFTLRPNNS